MARQAWSNSNETRKRRNSWRVLFSGCYNFLKEIGYEAEDFDDNWKVMQAALSIPKLETIICNDSRLIYKRDLRRAAAIERWRKRRESKGLSTDNPPIVLEPLQEEYNPASAPKATPARLLKGAKRLAAWLSPPSV